MAFGPPFGTPALDAVTDTKRQTLSLMSFQTELMMYISSESIPVFMVYS